MLNQYPNPLLPVANCQPICPFFYQCGGCDTQDRDYSSQVTYKQQWLASLLPGNDELWQPFLSSTQEYPIYFRNKIRFGFVEVEGKIWPSRHAKGEEEADIPVDHCFLQSPLTDQLINFTAQFAQDHGWSIYNPLSGKGWLKHLLIRQGKYTNQTLVSLVTSDATFKDKPAWVQAVQDRFPQITSLYHTTTQGRNNSHMLDHHLGGQPRIQEKVGEYLFYISPHAFFQTNSEMVTTLYDAIARSAKLSAQETVWDLYAGSATIGIYLASRAKRVLSIENNPANIRDARDNLALNHISNLQLHPGRVEEVISSQFIKQEGRPDLIIVDPPRAGLSPQLKAILPYLGTHRLLYVSCNPATFRRDLIELQAQGYHLKTLQGVDMFPHTLHCEIIGELLLP